MPTDQCAHWRGVPHCVAALCTQIRSPRSFSRDSALQGLVLVAPLCRREHLVREVVACLYDASEEVRASAVKAVAALSEHGDGVDPSTDEGRSRLISAMDHVAGRTKNVPGPDPPR